MQGRREGSYKFFGEVAKIAAGVLRSASMKGVTKGIDSSNRWKEKAKKRGKKPSVGRIKLESSMDSLTAENPNNGKRKET